VGKYSSSVLFSEMEENMLKTSKPCDIPEGIDEVANLVNQKGSGGILRSQIVTNADGDYIPLASAMGEGKSIVVFLRHMG